MKSNKKTRTISPKAGEKFISTAMRLQKKGKIEGRIEGIEKVAFSMLQKGYSDDEIMELYRYVFSNCITSSACNTKLKVYRYYTIKIL